MQLVVVLVFDGALLKPAQLVETAVANDGEEPCAGIRPVHLIEAAKRMQAGILNGIPRDGVAVRDPPRKVVRRAQVGEDLLFEAPGSLPCVQSTVLLGVVREWRRSRDRLYSRSLPAGVDAVE